MVAHYPHHCVRRVPRQAQKEPRPALLLSQAQKKRGPALLPGPTAPSMDLPVFAWRKPEGLRFRDPDSPAQASLPIRADPRILTASFVATSRRMSCFPLLLRFSPKAFRILIFRGPSWVGLLRAAWSPWGGNRPRKGGPTLPAPLADWSGFEFRRAITPRGSSSSILASIACRRRSGFPPLPHPSGRFRPSGEAGTSVPITTGICARFRFAQS